MDEWEQRSHVVLLARKWLGLPYRDGARLRGICGDCTFLALVYEDAGLISPVQIDPYSPQAHMHRTGSLYINAVRERAHETQTPKMGDLVMYWFGRDFSHGAIVGDEGWPQIIHADKAVGYIIEADGQQGQLARAQKHLFFTMW